MSKLTVLFYGFALVVLALFGVFSYLMSTVNPEGAPPGPAPGAEPDLPDPPLDEKDEVIPPPPAPAEDAEARKLMGPTSEWWSSTTSPDVVSIATSVERERKSLNDTELLKSSKGRRSINDRWKKNGKGIVIMNIFGDDGKPRVEIVFHPKRAKDIKWKNNLRSKPQDSNRRSAEFIYNSVLNIMPDDTVILEKTDYSTQRDLESYSKISEITKKTENIKDALVSESIWIDSLKTSKCDQETKPMSSIKNRSATEVRHTTVKTKSIQTKINNTVIVQDAFFGNNVMIETDTFTKNNDNISSQEISEGKKSEEITALTSAYRTMTYDDETEATGVTVSNVNNMVTNTTAQMNYIDNENLTFSVVTENPFSEALTKFTITTVTSEEESSKDIFPIEANTDENVFKTSTEISSVNAYNI